MKITTRYVIRSEGTVKADLVGGPLAPDIRGTVYFEKEGNGTRVRVDVTGLPLYQPAGNGNPPIGPHGFHIHEHGVCDDGVMHNPYQSAGGHWNPTNQPHGNHAGDFPVLFSNNGAARTCFYTDRFKPSDVVGRSVIIHLYPDDYRTQPDGDTGSRLVCGVIK